MTQSFAGMSTVGEIAEHFGVTVRTLHHYDDIGLLSPSERTRAGYRLYTTDDVARLRSIVVYRRLGFALSEIVTMLDAPDADPIEHLRRQHDLVRTRLEADRELLTALERAMEAEMTGAPLSTEEQRRLFGAEFADHTEEYRHEAKERWGETDAWQESQRRTASYGTAQWAEVNAEASQLNERVRQLMAAGLPPTSDDAMDAAEAHRQHINRWFYDCSPQMHRGLGEMYVSDPRFASVYENLATGLAAYLCAAISANTERQQESAVE